MVRFSEDFLNLIKRFSYNDIARKLIDISNNDIVSDYDYITTSDSNKFINFVSTRKIEELIQNSKIFKVIRVGNLTHSSANDEIFNAIGYDKNCEYWYPSEGHYGTLHGEVTSDKTGKTYVLFKSSHNGRYAVLNKDALEKTIPDLFLESKNKLKIGRLVTHIFDQNKIEFKPQDIEIFVNLYKSTFDIIGDKFSFFELVDGDDISNWYKKENYEDYRGTLGNSCMCEKESDFFKIYEENKNCKMLILKSNNGMVKDDKILSDKIVGRALIWQAKLIEGDKVRNITYMDRIYTNEDSDIDVFVNFAKENGWWYKCSQTYDTQSPITNGDEIINFHTHETRLDVDIENIYFDNYPFIDTFCYIKDEYTLTNNYSLNESEKAAHGLRSTCGSYETYDNYGTIDRILGND
jgi:hypothetical protein